MKRIIVFNLIIIAFLIGIFSGCDTKESEPNDKEKKIKEFDKALDIVQESGLGMIKLQPEGKSWRDVYEIYCKIDAKYGQDRITQGFRSSAISYSVLEQHLTDNPNSETLPVIARYAEDSYNMHLSNAQSDYLLLNALKGYWSEDKIKNYALKASKMAEAIIQEFEQAMRKAKQSSANYTEIEASSEKMALEYLEKTRLYSSKLKELCFSVD
jgi:hypothetical protein